MLYNPLCYLLQKMKNFTILKITQLEFFVKFFEKF
nr:MAG TPA: hypothetical protein [Caudoviricetes sp.]DAI46307.1 MAG TPA: hypothetical protein [Caudoviricetes sp.]DAK87639.1 MAG TPA: hypothetical protein [Bacteriophage sp.]DAV23388.1 MAG TPA: hypothetical protein [Bacteriophage sp.]